ncbi:MAG TPA: zinc-ribbon domain-containing protein [Gemmatimonadota bacterium]|nr:zinc-ribbon domain-containing protein [Gemmatimonadota bacterium]
MSNQSKTRPPAKSRHCTNCGAKHDPADRFCRECGAPLRAAGKPNGHAQGLKGLRAFGLAIIALAAIYAVLLYSGRAKNAPEPSQRIDFTSVGQPVPGATSQPLGSSPTLTGREAADQLFNQAMYAYETGDSATANQFIPMALSAYRNLASLDMDGRYHIALLELAAGRPLLAIAQADTMLAAAPEHLLALTVTGRSYESLGQEERAIEFYQRFLASYTPDVAVSRTEYMDHAGALPLRRDHAQRYLQERGIRQED